MIIIKILHSKEMFQAFTAEIDVDEPYFSHYRTGKLKYLIKVADDFWTEDLMSHTLRFSYLSTQYNHYNVLLRDVDTFTGDTLEAAFRKMFDTYQVSELFTELTDDRVDEAINKCLDDVEEGNNTTVHVYQLIV